MSVTSAPILAYAPRGSTWRRRWRRIAAAVLLTGVMAVGAYHRTTVKSWTTIRYAAWQHARAFDAARQELMPQGVWLGDTADAAGQQKARAAITALAGLGCPLPGRPGAAISFIRYDRSTGADAMCFVGDHQVITVWRDQPGYGYASRRWVPHIGNTRDWGAIDNVKSFATTQPETVRTVITRDDSENVVDWQLSSGPSMTLIDTPRTGWLESHGFWIPERFGVRHLQPTTPPAVLPVDTQPGNFLRLGSISFLPDGGLAVIVDGNLVRFTHEPVKLPGTVIHRISSNFRNAVFSEDGTQLFGTNFRKRGEAYVLNTLSGSVRTLQWPTNQLISDGDQLQFVDARTAGAFGERILYGIDWTGNGDMKKIGEYKRWFARWALSRNLLAMCISPKKVEIRRRADLSLLATIPNVSTGYHGRDVRMEFAPDERSIVINHDFRNAIYELPTGRLLHEFVVRDDFISSDTPVRWTPDSRLGTIVGRNYVYVFCMQPPRWVARFAVPEGYHVSALSPDGRRLAVASMPMNEVRYWDNLPAATQPSTGVLP